MRKEVRVFLAVFIALFLFPVGICAAQTNVASASQSQYARRFQNGTELYTLARWQEAAIEFRRAQENAQVLNDWAQSLYWVILSELAFSDYGSALRDMDELERNAPNSNYARDMVYHRARVYFIQGFFDDALVLFNKFINSVPDNDRVSSDRRAAAFFWMGECLFTMSQFDEAEKFYSWVVARYPQSVKVEASAYRIDLIKQKKIESELLALLQLSHEESLRTSEEYQRTIRTYEHTLNIYQRRLAEPRETSLGVHPLETPDRQETPKVETESSNSGLFYELNVNDDLIERAIQLRDELRVILEGAALDR